MRCCCGNFQELCEGMSVMVNNYIHQPLGPEGNFCGPKERHDLRDAKARIADLECQLAEARGNVETMRICNGSNADAAEQALAQVAELQRNFGRSIRKVLDLERQLVDYKAVAEVEADEGDIARTQAARLREALKKYGQHKPRCAWSRHGNDIGFNEPCVCGFIKALAGDGGQEK